METTPWDPEGATVVLDAEGRLADASSAAGLDLKTYYKQLVGARCLDLRLSRSGLPMWASAAGEESALVATSLVADADDWIYPGMRDAGLAYARGVPIEAVVRRLFAMDGLAEMPGRVSHPSHRIASPTDSLGLHLALAAGHARALKLQRASEIVFASLGEGLTTTGPFYEALTLAVAGDLPLVFVCRSQVWPGGAPAEAGSVGDSVSDRARTVGLWARRVDGADPVAVHAAIASAATRARDNRGPGLVEVLVTQMQHDPPAHRDPVERLRRHLDLVGMWTQTFQDVLEAEVRGHLDRALQAIFADEENLS